MKKISLSPKPKSSPLRRTVGPVLVGALLASTGGCIGYDVGVVGLRDPEPETPVDGGSDDDAGTAGPEVVGLPAEPDVVGEPEEPAVGVPPEDVDGGEPGVDG